MGYQYTNEKMGREAHGGTQAKRPNPYVDLNYVLSSASLSLSFKTRGTCAASAPAA